jgi:4-hydroxybenzoate polyprenyltransferase
MSSPEVPTLPPQGGDADPVPLCVDLDGTLLRTDTLMEGALELLQRNVAFAFWRLLWLLRGRSVLKDEIARRVSLDVRLLPEHPAFTAWLHEQKARGRRLLLCTAAAGAQGDAIAARFGIFDGVLASDRKHNLAGRAKAERLVAEFGEGGFDYAGNALRDVPVWRAARAAVVVAPTLPLSLALSRVPRREALFPGTRSRTRAWLRAARPHHWAKNALIFVPLLAAQAAGSLDLLAAAAVAFLAFSLAASGIYVYNDLFDLAADRAHPAKRNRPFASGELQAIEGLLGGTALVAGGLVIGYVALDGIFVAVLLGYIAATSAYSSIIKRRAVVDILWLAGLYTGRILAGSAATGIEPSFWLLAFSMFLFLSLAAAKRSAELAGLESRNEQQAPGRGYAVTDLPLLLAFGVAAAYTSVLVLAMYIFTRADDLYAHAELLWLLCPALLYWLSRIWLKVHRRQLHEDPLVFAFTDVPSVAVGIACALLVWAAA